MDSFKLGLFDLFGYIFPGIIVSLTIYFATQDISSDPISIIIELGTLLSEMSGYTILILIFGSYILGFTIHYFGYNYFNLIGKKIWKKTLSGKEKGLSDFNEQMILIRDKSPENFKYAEIWSVFRAMSFNLSLTFFLFSLLIVLKLILASVYSGIWLLVSLSFMIVAWVMLRRAVSFHIWAYEIIENSKNILNLN